MVFNGAPSNVNIEENKKADKITNKATLNKMFFYNQNCKIKRI